MPTFSDPKMQAAHERAEAEAAKNRDKTEEQQVTGTGRRMMGVESDVERRLRVSNQNAIDQAAALEKLLDETERRMMGLPGPPGPLDDVKVMPGSSDELCLQGGSTWRPDRKVLRSFLLTHGRAPTREELLVMISTSASSKPR